MNRKRGVKWKKSTFMSLLVFDLKDLTFTEKYHYRLLVYLILLRKGNTGNFNAYISACVRRLLYSKINQFDGLSFELSIII